MAQQKVNIAEGWSAPIDFQLFNDDVAQDLTNMTVTGQAYDRLKNAVALASDVSVLTATAGKVRLTPDTDDFVEEGSPYELRFKVVDSGNAAAFFPSAEPVAVIVRR